MIELFPCPAVGRGDKDIKSHINTRLTIFFVNSSLNIFASQGLRSSSTSPPQNPAKADKGEEESHIVTIG